MKSPAFFALVGATVIGSTFLYVRRTSHTDVDADWHQLQADAQPLGGGELVLADVDPAPSSPRSEEEQVSTSGVGIGEIEVAKDVERRAMWHQLMAENDPSEPIPDLKKRITGKLSRAVLEFQDLVASENVDQAAADRKARIVVALGLLATKLAIAPTYDNLSDARNGTESGRVISLEGVYFTMEDGESALFDELEARRSQPASAFTDEQVGHVLTFAEEALGWLE